MSEIEGLLAMVDALETMSGDPVPIFASLREGLAEVDERLSELRQANQDLNARRESLEQQVMDMANDAWENIIVLFDDPDPAA